MTVHVAYLLQFLRRPTRCRPFRYSQIQSKNSPHVSVTRLFSSYVYWRFPSFRSLQQKYRLYVQFFSCYVNFTFSHFSPLILPLITLRNEYRFCGFWLCCFISLSDYVLSLNFVEPGGHVVWDGGLWSLAFSDCGFESPGVMDVCLLWVLYVRCQVEVSVSGRSLVQRFLTDCGVSECDREASSIMRRPFPTSGCCFMKNKSLNFLINNYTLNTLNLGKNPSHSFRYF
jgi:hypothetical protein